MSPENYFALVRDLIRNAESSIDIEQQYIKVGGKRTKDLLRELAARKNEVEIRIIVSAAYEEGWIQSVDSVRAAGLYSRLRALSLDSFTHLHNKGVLVDGKYTVVTSTNMSENSITQAREAGVLIESEAIGEYYRRAVDVDWASGIAPSDVKHHIASFTGEAGEAVEVETVEVHPADLRVV
jgi:phosphatidylserine/phosphatidylglycerophosphate/cardiolipin synthase-like enzyme